MLKNLSTSILFILLTLSLLLNSCGNKDDQNKTKKDEPSGAANSDLVVKDEKGSKVTLTIKPKKRRSI